jgi:transcriptional regulator with XRE-family HTH domain
MATLDPTDAVSFGGLLRHHRLTAHLTQEELAARCGLGARTLQNLERGVNRPRPETLQRLATSLGLVGEAHARFTAAGHPVARGPRGVATRFEGDQRAGLLNVVQLVDWRQSEPIPKLVTGDGYTENTADFHELAVPNTSQSTERASSDVNNHSLTCATFSDLIVC